MKTTGLSTGRQYYCNNLNRWCTLVYNTYYINLRKHFIVGPLRDTPSTRRSKRLSFRLRNERKYFALYVEL